MADKFHHEAVYRGNEQIAILANQQLTICGAVRWVRIWPTTWLARAFGSFARLTAIEWKNTTSARSFTASRMSAIGRSKSVRQDSSAQPASRSRPCVRN